MRIENLLAVNQHLPLHETCQTTGRVIVRQECVDLTPRSTITFPITLEPIAGLCLGLQLPARDGAAIELRLANEGCRARVALVFRDGVLSLVNKQQPEEIVPLSHDQETIHQAWFLRCELRHGLVRVKAWPQQEEEPASWLSTRYSGRTGWRPRLLQLRAGSAGNVSIDRLEVSGVSEELVPRASHPDVRRANELSAEALRLHELGNDSDASLLALEAAHLCREQLGEHPRTAAALNNLGMLLKGMGLLENARMYYEQALVIQLATLGADHPETACTSSNLALLLRAGGRLDEALRLMREARAGHMVLGLDHPRTAAYLRNLALLLSESGKPACGVTPVVPAKTEDAATDSDSPHTIART